MLLSLPHSALVHPLPLRGIAKAGLLLIAALTAWCQLNNLIAQGDIPPMESLLWAAVHALSWGGAWELIKRQSGTRPTRDIALILLTALMVCALGHLALFTLLDPSEPRALLPLLYTRAQVAGLLALAALVLRFAPRTPLAWPASECNAQEVAPEDRSNAALPTPAACVETETSPDNGDTAAATGAATAADTTPLCLAIPTRQGVVQLPAQDIDYLKAAANYVEIFAGDKTWLLRSPLGELAATVAPAGFLRIHRSLVVNCRRVVRIQPTGKQPTLLLNGGARLPIGRQYVSTVNEALLANASSEFRVRP